MKGFTVTILVGKTIRATRKQVLVAFQAGDTHSWLLFFVLLKNIITHLSSFFPKSSAFTSSPSPRSKPHRRESRTGHLEQERWCTCWTGAQVCPLLPELQHWHSCNTQGTVQCQGTGNHLAPGQTKGLIQSAPPSPPSSGGEIINWLLGGQRRENICDKADRVIGRNPLLGKVSLSPFFVILISGYKHSPLKEILADPFLLLLSQASTHMHI